MQQDIQYMSGFCAIHTRTFFCGESDRFWDSVGVELETETIQSQVMPLPQPALCNVSILRCLTGKVL